MSNDRNLENRNGSKQRTDSLTTVVFEELDPDDINEVAGGYSFPCGSCSNRCPGGGGGGGGTGAFTVA